MSEAPTEGKTEIALPERCGASCAHELVEAGRAMEPGGRLTIGADQVSRMSCAAVVALISLAKTAAQTGGNVVIRAPTGAFTDAFSHLGLFESLMSMEFAE